MGLVRIMPAKCSEPLYDTFCRVLFVNHSNNCLIPLHIYCYAAYVRLFLASSTASWFTFYLLVQVKSIPVLGTGKHKYSSTKVEVPPLPVNFCDCEEHWRATGTTRLREFHNGQAEIDGDQ